MANDFVRNIKGVRNINKLSRNITTENDLISTNDNDVYVVTNGGYKKITGGETEQDIELLEKDVKNLKTSTDNNTSEIEKLQTSTGNNTSEIEKFKTSLEENTSEIENFKTSTDNNTSKIRTLETKTGNNSSEIENLKTKTDNNGSEIETLKKSTDNNTSEIKNLKKSTSNNETNIDSTQTLIEKLQTQLDDLESNTKQYYTLFEGSKRGVGSKIPLNDDFHSFHLLYLSGEFPGGVFTETILVKALIDNISIQRLNLRDSDGIFLGAYEIKLTPNKNTELEITNDVSWDELGSTGTGQDRNAYTITNIEGVK